MSMNRGPDVACRGFTPHGTDHRSAPTPRQYVTTYVTAINTTARDATFITVKSAIST